ncbi:MAG: FliH/SctL family protein [bacterium]
MGLIKASKYSGLQVGGESLSRKTSILKREDQGSDRSSEASSEREGAVEEKKGNFVLIPHKEKEAPPKPAIKKVEEADVTPGAELLRKTSSQEADSQSAAPAGEENSAQPPSLKLDDVIVREAETKAAQLLQHAQSEARKLLDESRLYCQSVQKQAARDGFSQGKEEGFRAAYEEVASLIQEARKVLQEAVNHQERILANSEPEIARLAIKIAERILGVEVKTNPETVLGIIQAALKRIRDREQVTIRVNQEDYEKVKAHKDTYTRLVDGVKTMDIAPDPRVERGGCIIETNLGNVDARISTQLAALEIAFKGVEKSDSDGQQSTEKA